MPPERIRLRIGNLGKAVLVTGQAYQDPKDAFNEFISNAADEYAEAGIKGGRIRVVLRRRGGHPVIAVEDEGRGLDEESLRRVARSLFESSKSGDPRTLGEKAIGVLAFQQLGGRCDIVSRATGADITLTLRLERGKATAELSTEKRRARTTPGTTVYLSDLDPDVLRVLTQRKIVDYLRRRRGPAIANGDYVIEVIESKRAEVVTAEEPDGVPLRIPAQEGLWGRIEFAIFVAPRPDRMRRVAVVGRGGTTIIDDISEIEEFGGAPWSSDQVSGRIVYEELKQTAGRRAILRDREAFPIFVDAVKAIEPAVSRTLEQIAREVDADVADRLSDAVRRIFGRVLKELADLENPMRSLAGTEDGEGALMIAEGGQPPLQLPPTPREAPEVPPIEDLIPPAGPHTDRPDQNLPPEARPSKGRFKHLPNIAKDPTPDGARSRFDEEARTVYYNDLHPDYLLVKDEQGSLLDYLATLVAKELVLYNNPRAEANDLGEEMVRMLVRVRKHMPRKI